MQMNASEKGISCLWFTVNEHSMHLKELLGKWRFKAKYDYSAEKLKNVLIK